MTYPRPTTVSAACRRIALPILVLLVAVPLTAQSSDSMAVARDSARHANVTHILSSGGADLAVRGALSLAGSELDAQTLPENVRVTIQLIQADGFEDPDPAIGDVVAELSELFRFDGYRLLGEASFVAAVPGPGENGTRIMQTVSGTTPDLGTDSPAEPDEFQIELGLGGTAEDGRATVEVALVDVRPSSLRRTADASRNPTVLSLTFTARYGQSIVIGASKYDPEKPTLIVRFRMEPLDG